MCTGPDFMRNGSNFESGGVSVGKSSLKLRTVLVYRLQDTVLWFTGFVERFICARLQEEWLCLPDMVSC